jgi:hypothetical protein
MVQTAVFIHIQGNAAAQPLAQFDSQSHRYCGGIRHGADPATEIEQILHHRLAAARGRHGAPGKIGNLAGHHCDNRKDNQVGQFLRIRDMQAKDRFIEKERADRHGRQRRYQRWNHTAKDRCAQHNRHEEYRCRSEADAVTENEHHHAGQHHKPKCRHALQKDPHRRHFHRFAKMRMGIAENHV